MVVSKLCGWWSQEDMEKVGISSLHTELEPREICVDDGKHNKDVTEAYTTAELPAEAIHVQVDTGTGRNVMPLYLFQHLHPYQFTDNGQPTGLMKTDPPVSPILALQTSHWCILFNSQEDNSWTTISQQS